VIFRVIRDHLTPEFRIVDCCRVLAVSVSGYYRWRRRPEGKRETRRAELVTQIRVVHEASRCTYGAPRVQRALQQRGLRLNRKTVARLMRESSLRARMIRRFRVRTTDSNHAHPVAANVLDRRFTAPRPNAVWLCDITYIPNGEGWLYLAGVLDLYSRRIVGWSMAEHLRAELVQAALTMATAARRPAAGLIHHSDRGVQYCCAEYRKELAAWGMVASMSRVGDCYDNAPKESFWATLKKELMSERTFATRSEARAAVFEYIEVFYNRQRLHSSLGYLSPEQFEAGQG
jgi:transposase InsO family protein